MKRIFNIFLKHSWIALILIIIVTAVFFRTIRKNSRMETDLDEYMPQKHSAFVYSNKAEEWFDIKDGIIIAVENRDGIYSSSSLQKIKELTKKLQKMEEFEKNDVTSLYTADNITGTEEGLDVQSFYRKVPKSAKALENLRDSVRNNEMIFGRLVSVDEKVALIIARIEDDVFSQNFYHRILNLAKSYQGPEKLYVAGRPIVEGTMAYLGPRDMKKMVPVVIFVIVLVLLLVMRSIKSTVFTLLVVLFSTVWTFGLMAALNIPIYAVSTMIPVMLIAIGVADGIHLYSHLKLFIRENPDSTKRDAVMDMLHQMWKPVVMTSVTTAVGFISLLTSQVYPIKYFGLFTAFGVIMAMVFSLVLIPAGIMLFGLPGWKREKEDDSGSDDHFFYLFAEKTVKYRYLTLVIAAIVIVVSVFGIRKVWINSSFLDKFEEDSDIVQTDRFINKHFGGTNVLNIILEGKQNNIFKNPELLRTIDEMQSEVETVKVVGNSFSLADYLKRMNKVMHADREKYNSIPDSQELIAQYLLLYEMSGEPENLWQVVDYKYRKANLTVQLKSDSSKALQKAIGIIEKYKSRLNKKDVEINYAGSGYKGLVFTELILQGQIWSLLASVVIIIVLLTAMFKKLSIGLIGSVPIVITALISFGIMGGLNIPLNTTTALVSSIAVGIGIDYAVHFIERYRIYAFETEDKNSTIRLTMHHSGRAIVSNAAVVIAGFLVLLFSVFPPNRVLGALVSLNMFTSFLGTVTVMFLLLYMTNIYFSDNKQKGD